MTDPKVKPVPLSDPTKYDDWAFRMTSVFALMDLDNIVNAQSLDGVDAAKNTKVFHIILAVCEGPIMSTLRAGIAQLAQRHKTSGHHAWNILRKKYGTTTDTAVMAVNREIMDQPFTTLEEYTEYITTRLAKLRSSDSSVKMDDTAVLARVITAVPAEYSAVVHAHMGKQNGTVDELIQDLQDFAIARGPALAPSSSNAFAVHGRGNERGERAGGFGDRRGGPRRGPPRGPSRCFLCDKTGHRSFDCPLKKKFHEFLNGSGPSSAHAVGAPSSSFIVDSGAEIHVIGKHGLSLFDNITMVDTNKMTVGTANGQAAVRGVGTVTLEVLDDQNRRRPLVLTDALYVPSCDAHLISAGQLIDRGEPWPTAGHATSFVQSKQPYIEFADGSRVPLVDSNNRALLQNAECPPNHKVHTVSATSVNIKTLHERLGHLNMADVRKVAKTHGITVSDDSGGDFCDQCALGKSKKAAVAKAAAPRDLAPGELTHTDIVGPFEQPALSGGRYAVVFVDDATRWGQVYVVANKTDAWRSFDMYRTWMAGHKFDIGRGARVQSDSDVVYNQGEFAKRCTELGITIQCSPPYTQQMNGVAERYVQTVKDMARTMLLHSKLGKRFWGLAMTHAAFVRNLCPTVALDGRSPHEALFGRPGPVHQLHTFGCRAFVNVAKSQRKALDPKARVGVYVGKGQNRTHLVFMPDTNKVVRTFHVVFNEQALGIVDNSAAQHDASGVDELFNMVFGADVEGESAPASVDSSDVDSGNNDPPSASSDDTSDVSGPASPVSTTNSSTDPPYHFRHPRRDPSPELDQLLQESDDDSSTAYVVHSLGNGTPEYEPRSYAEAKNSPHAELWEQARQAEIDKLVENGTWTTVRKDQVPAGKTIMPLKEIYKVKTRNGEFDKLKVRIVAKGFLQKEGKDVTSDVYAPVAHLSALRLQLAIAALRGYEVHHVDVANAFLNAPISDDVYIKLPEGVTNVDQDGNPLVGKLVKALYGTKQGSRAWYDEAHKTLTGDGYTCLKSEPCFFFKRYDDGELSIVVVWVDDFSIAALANRMIEAKSPITKKYKHTDYGLATALLGFNLTQDTSTGTIKLDQAAYTKEVLKRFGMQDSRPVGTPLVVNTVLTKDDPEATELDTDQAREYRAILGSLNYLAVVSRGDISFAVSRLGRFAAAPTDKHLVAAKHLLRYVCGTADFALTFRRDGNKDMVAYVDASFGTVQDPHSVTGYVVFLAGAPIAWRSKRQTVVAQSTAESEYIALAAVTREIIGFRNILSEMGEEPDKPTVVYEDNEPCIKIATNPMTTHRTKHIALPYHLARDAVTAGTIVPAAIATSQQVADGFTKVLPKTATSELRETLTGRRPLPGGV